MAGYKSQDRNSLLLHRARKRVLSRWTTMKAEYDLPELKARKNPYACKLKKPVTMRFLLFISLLLGLCHAGRAEEKLERADLLDATRPVAAKLAGQPVRLRVDRLSQDSGWAILVGKLVGLPGQALNWEQTKGCHPDLDKILWVVLQKDGQAWQVKHIDICAPEPPYWYLEQYGGLVWPCGVYAGLQSSEGSDLEQQCRANSRGRRKTR